VPFCLEMQADIMAVYMQHGLAGACALWATTMTSDKASFLKFARWGVLFEAGWELFDSWKNILYPTIFKGKAFDFRKFTLLAHHVTLYSCLLLNRMLLETDYLGRDLAWGIALYAGWIGPLAILNFTKSFADVSTLSGMLTYTGCHLVSVLGFAFGRAIHWPYLAYKLVTQFLGENWMGFSFGCLMVLLFSLCNLVFILITWKRFLKSVKKIQKSYAELKEKDVLVPKNSAKYDRCRNSRYERLRLTAGRFIAGAIGWHLGATRFLSPKSKK